MSHPFDGAERPLVRQQRTDQRLDVDSVRLRPTAPALDSDGCGIDDMALDALLPQGTVDPKAIKPGLLDGDDGKASPRPRLRLPLQVGKSRQERRDVPPGTECLDILSPPPGNSDVTSQVDRLSSSDTKIASRFVQMVVRASGRPATFCMPISRKVSSAIARSQASVAINLLMGSSRIAAALAAPDGRAL